MTADVCAVVDVTGLRCQKEPGHWGYVHEADDGVGLASWCVDECDCWMWSSYVPHGFSAEPAADVYPLAVP